MRTSIVDLPPSASDLSPDVRRALKLIMDARERQRSLPPRPGVRDVGKALFGLAEVYTLSLWGRRGLDPTAGEVLRPLRHSPGDLKVKSSLNPDNAFVVDTVNWLVHATRDHLDGLATLCRAGAPLRTILAVSRVLIDPAMHVSYILDDTIPESTRIARTFNLRQEALRQESLDASPGAPGEDKELLAGVQAERDQLREAAREDGLPFAQRKNGTYEHYILAPRNSSEQIYTAVLGSLGADAWRTLSSAAHSQERSHLRIPLGGLGTPQGHATDWMGLFWVYVAVEATIHAIEASTRYLGGAAIPDTVIAPVRYMLRAAADAVPDDERLEVAARLGWVPPSETQVT